VSAVELIQEPRQFSNVQTPASLGVPSSLSLRGKVGAIAVKEVARQAVAGEYRHGSGLPLLLK
jgi:hypothetical protein